MSTATLNESSTEISLANLATDLRTFVTNLQRPKFGDMAWVRAARQHCQDLSERLGVLKEKFDERREAMPQAVADMRAALQSMAGELGERYHWDRFKEYRATLGRRYEDLLAQLRSLRDWRPEVAEKLRSIRLPSWSRSVFHLVMGMGGVLLYEFVLSFTAVVSILLGLVVIFTGLEVSRRFSSSFNDFMVDKLFGAISRPQERYKVNSATWYLMALTLIVFFTPKEAACVGALALAFGDPLASAVGSRFGRYRLRNDKSLVGSLSFFVASGAAICLYFVFLTDVLAWPQLFFAAAFVAFVGALVELFSDRLDDNFTVPVICALTALVWI